MIVKKKSTYTPSGTSPAVEDVDIMWPKGFWSYDANKYYPFKVWIGELGAELNYATQVGNH